MKGQQLQVVDKFTYRGSTLSRVVHIDDEVNARIAKASAAFGRRRGIIWDRCGIRLDTKLKVYRSVVLPTLLYACETWRLWICRFPLPLGVWEGLRFVIVVLPGFFSYLFFFTNGHTLFSVLYVLTEHLY